MHRRTIYIWLLVLAAAAAVGCRDRHKDIADLSAMFTPSGEEMVRYLGIYAGTQRVGDLRMSRVKGLWLGEEAVQLSESVHLRLSFRSDRFSVTSSQVSWVGEGMDLKASTGSMDFGAGRWETTVLKIKDNVYERNQINAGSKSSDRISVPEGVIISDILPLYLDKASLKEDTRLNLGVFNMTLGQEFPLTLHYLGLSEEGRSYALSYWGMEEQIWLDESGMVVKEDMVLGVSARAPGGEGAGRTSGAGDHFVADRRARPSDPGGSGSNGKGSDRPGRVFPYSGRGEVAAGQDDRGSGRSDPYETISAGA